jgi:hypothetical protein
MTYEVGVMTKATISIQASLVDEIGRVSSSLSYTLEREETISLKMNWKATSTSLYTGGPLSLLGEVAFSKASASNYWKAGNILVEYALTKYNTDPTSASGSFKTSVMNLTNSKFSYTLAGLTVPQDYVDSYFQYRIHDTTLSLYSAWENGTLVSAKRVANFTESNFTLKQTLFEGANPITSYTLDPKQSPYIDRAAGKAVIEACLPSEFDGGLKEGNAWNESPSVYTDINSSGLWTKVKDGYDRTFYPLTPVKATGETLTITGQAVFGGSVVSTASRSITVPGLIHVLYPVKFVVGYDDGWLGIGCNTWIKIYYRNRNSVSTTVEWKSYYGSEEMSGTQTIDALQSSEVGGDYNGKKLDKSASCYLFTRSTCTTSLNGTPFSYTSKWMGIRFTPAETESKAMTSFYVKPMYNSPVRW